MKKSILLSLLFCVSLCFGQTTPAADDKKEKITKSIADYFAMDRENIHVHLDKNVFTTKEQVWFKGYVIQRKVKVPNYTSNVYGSLLDETGKVLKTQLMYCNAGSFSGSFALQETLPSGKYYLQFYTNWMNNFAEDESSVYEISVVNQADGPGFLTRQIDHKSLNIEFFAEGGAIVRNLNNSGVIKVSGCDQRPVALASVNIINSKGDVIKTVSLNKYGYGKFDLPATETGLKAIAKLNGKTFEATIPTGQMEGVALEVNNYSVAGKTIIKVAVNSFTQAKYSGKKLYMVVQQDDKSAIQELDFTNSPEIRLAVANTDLPAGINIIRILDDNLNQIAERLIFQYPDALKVTSLTTAANDTLITVSGNINTKMAFISASVLPENTLSMTNENDLYTSLLLYPQIRDSRNPAGRYYFESISKARHYELDMYLISQISKYRWSYITAGAPKEKFEFDRGLKMKVTVPANLPNKNAITVQLFSAIDYTSKTSPVNDKGEAVFENLILSDSSRVGITVFEKNIARKDIKASSQLIGNIRTFNKMYKPVPAQCTYTIPTESTTDLELPKFSEDVIELEEVKIQAEYNKLKRKNAPGHTQLRGYKITPSEVAGFYYILDFIRFQGFEVNISGTNVSITNRFRNSINGAPPSPMVYLDNFILMTYDQLFNMPTEDVDEIYLNPNANVPGINNKFGIIRIYMKSNYTKKLDSPNSAILITGGFSRYRPYKGDSYASTSGKGYENFAVIGWEPKIMTDSKGDFKFRMPRTSQKTVKILIEGFSKEGMLISEVKTINLN